MKFKLHYSLLGLLIVFIFSGLYVEFLIFFLVIILHELGHLFVIVLFKQKLITFNLTIVGAILDVEYKDLKIYQEALISIAGVLVNGLILIFTKYLGNLYYQDILIKYNLLLIIFNLLPIYPLDGFHLLEALFRIKNDPFFEQKLLKKISIITLITTFLFAIIYLKTLSILIVFAFLIYHNLVLYLYHTQFVLKKFMQRYKYKKVLE